MEYGRLDFAQLGSPLCFQFSSYHCLDFPQVGLSPSSLMSSRKPDFLLACAPFLSSVVAALASLRTVPPSSLPLHPFPRGWTTVTFWVHLTTFSINIAVITLGQVTLEVWERHSFDQNKVLKTSPRRAVWCGCHSMKWSRPEETRGGSRLGTGVAEKHWEGGEKPLEEEGTVEPAFEWADQLNV